MGIILSNNAKFNPYTFDEMLKPLAMATEAYTKTQEGLIDLGNKAELMRQYVNENPNSPYAAQYMDYINKIEDSAKSLNTIGLTPDNQQAFNTLRRTYNATIAPIERAVETRKTIAEEQRKLSASNPSLMFDRDFSEVNLQELIDNPQLGYSAVSGDDIYTKGKEAGAAASSRAIEAVKGLGGQYWAIRQGYGAEQANNWLLEQNTIPELKEAVDRLVRQSNVTKKNKARATDYAISGIMSGMAYKESYQANGEYVDAAKRKSIDLSERQLKLDEAKLQLQEEAQWGREIPNSGGKRMLLNSGAIISYDPRNPTEGTTIQRIKGGSDESNKNIVKAAKTTDTPLIIAKTGGQWHSYQEGDDAVGVIMGATRSNVVSRWGNVYVPSTSTDTNKQRELVTDNINRDIDNLGDIPKAVVQMINKSQQTNNGNLDLSKYVLVKVRSNGNRPNSNGLAEPYDYILYPKDRWNQEHIKQSSNNSNNSILGGQNGGL